ncbi:CHAP domain-containing protein [Streptococcus thermophilus]|nr:CHAP domain-containing protein [Streptococcus thermophilus]MCE2173162.1 CHAP domain-containing protein [Streptococcus thermophilus]MCE2176442.1 CHAP domain-containing protein [Streptococcus thermophilus]MCE2178171.1 CHAP domain-containing protein [Streptococcus thermophilus]MCE2179775.1 CHAP domain-containing protein [Streptococcus thermophilus]
MGDLFFSIVSQYSVATYQLAAENGMTIWSRLVLGGTVESLSSWCQCTWGVKEITLWGSNWWCNGGDWAGSTASQGYAVGSISAARSIVCWTDGGY